MKNKQVCLNAALHSIEKKDNINVSFQTWINSSEIVKSPKFGQTFYYENISDLIWSKSLCVSKSKVSIKIIHKRINFLKTYRIGTFKNQRGSDQVVFGFFRICRFNHKRSLVQNDVAICPNLKK